MNQTIYLLADRNGIIRMTKSLPALSRGQIPVKLDITIKETAFREPVIEQAVVIEDWRQGIDIADIELKESIITDKEAEMIRQQRVERMREILEAQGFTVTEKTGDEA